MEKVYGLKYSARDVLNLDSSTAEKFSRHLIFILSDCAFKDNRHVGECVIHTAGMETSFTLKLTYSFFYSFTHSPMYLLILFYSLILLLMV